MTWIRSRMPWWALALVAVVLTLLFAPRASVEAKATYSNKDLKGTYHYTVAEIQVQGPDLEYCDSHGSISFDGTGLATIAGGVRRCTRHPSGTVSDEVEDGEFSYQVFANGEFVLTELDEFGNPTPYVTHGRIVSNGKLLLVDGTLKQPDILLQTAVASKE